MDDRLPDEKPARAWLWYFVGLGFLIGVALVMLGTGTAKAQAPQNLCAPLSQIVPAWRDTHQEQIVWEGTSPTPNGPIEVVLFQSPAGTWTLFIVQQGIACMRAAGNAGTAILETGKGV